MSVSPVLSVAEQSARFLDRRHEGRPPGPVGGASAWRGSDFSAGRAWIELLAPDTVAAFEGLIAALPTDAGRLDRLTPADVRLPGQETLFARWRDELTCGKGFLVLRGAPVQAWSPVHQKTFMRVLGLQFGRLGLQNPQGDVIGEVRDTGAARRDPFARLYATSGEFRFHCDACDLVGLLCVRPAARGGESKIASSVTVHDEILRRRPDLAPLLFERLQFDLRNEQRPDGQPFAEIAPCAFADGRLKTFYISDYFRSVERLGIAMPPDRRELLDLYDAVAAEPGVGLSFRLEPGDVQLLYNHSTLHARTAFEDAPGRARLLLRFLVSLGA